MLENSLPLLRSHRGPFVVLRHQAAPFFNSMRLKTFQALEYCWVRAVTSKRGERTVSVPPSMALKAAVYLAVRKAGISNSELARRMRLDEKEARRILDPQTSQRRERRQALIRPGPVTPVAPLTPGCCDDRAPTTSTSPAPRTR